MNCKNACLRLTFCSLTRICKCPVWIAVPVRVLYYACNACQRTVRFVSVCYTPRGPAGVIRPRRRRLDRGARIVQIANLRFSVKIVGTFSVSVVSRSCIVGETVPSTTRCAFAGWMGTYYNPIRQNVMNARTLWLASAVIFVRIHSVWCASGGVILAVTEDNTRRAS
jgi:hypothetical protein